MVLNNLRQFPSLLSLMHSCRFRNTFICLRSPRSHPPLLSCNLAYALRINLTGELHGPSGAHLEYSGLDPTETEREFCVFAHRDASSEKNQELEHQPRFGGYGEILDPWLYVSSLKDYIGRSR